MESVSVDTETGGWVNGGAEVIAGGFGRIGRMCDGPRCSAGERGGNWDGDNVVDRVSEYRATE